MPTGEELAAKLENAVKEESESASDKETGSKATAVSEDAAKSKEKTPSGNEDKETRESKGSTHVPYDRFKQKVDQVQTLEEKLQAATAKAEEVTEREEKLRKQIVQLEQEHDVLERLRALADDEKYRPMLERLDKALKGIDDEVEAGTKTEEEGKEDARKLFEKESKKINEEVDKKTAEMIFQHANLIADRMLEALPETYNAADRKAISQDWSSAVDWNKIEEDSSVMKEELQRSFKSVVEAYGEPRGALEKYKAELEELKAKAEEEAPEKPKSAEDIVKGIIDKDWSKVKTKEDGTVIGPELDDGEFEQDLAKVLKLAGRAGF